MSSPCHFLQGKRKGEETNGDGDSNERFLEPGGRTRWECTSVGFPLWLLLIDWIGEIGEVIRRQLAKRQPSTSWLPCFRILAVTVVVCSQPICSPMHRFYYLHVLLSVKVRDIYRHIPPGVWPMCCSIYSLFWWDKKKGKLTSYEGSGIVCCILQTLLMWWFHLMSFEKLTPRYFPPASSHRCGMGAVCCFLLVGTRIS